MQNFTHKFQGPGGGPTWYVLKVLDDFEFQGLILLSRPFSGLPPMGGGTPPLGDQKLPETWETQP